MTIPAVARHAHIGSGAGSIDDLQVGPGGGVSPDASLTGTSGDDTLTGTDGADQIDGQGGGDLLSGLGGNDFIQGGFGNDTVHGGDGDDQLQGGRLTGHSVDQGSHNQVFGEAGNDSIYGGEGGDLLDGGDGADFIQGSYSAADTIFGGDGDDLVNQYSNNSQNDEVHGGDGDDKLNDVGQGYGDAGADTINGAWADGGAGDDVLHVDTGIGGRGTDEIYISWNGTADGGKNDAGAPDTVHVGDNGTGEPDVGFSVDVAASARGVAQQLVEGGSFVNFEQGDIYGSDASDTLSGGALDDTLQGGEGDDHVNGRAGNDVLLSSFADYGADDDHDTLSGGDGDDYLFGPGSSLMFGGRGNDTIDGVSAGKGTAVASYADATTSVTINLATGVSTDQYGDHDTILNVNAVVGGSAGDQMTGGASADRLEGGGGADTLSGGDGIDTLVGGAGKDHFVYMPGDSTSTYTDLIADLERRDTIDVSAVDADKKADGDQAFTLVDAFTGHAGELTVTYDASNDVTLIGGDRDGDGQADFLVDALGDHSGFSNFVL